MALDGMQYTSQRSAGYSRSPLSASINWQVSPEERYRGAVVEDLQLPPAFALPISEPIGRAIEMAYDRDFSYFPVLDDGDRRPVGYVEVGKLKELWETGRADPNDPVEKYIVRFKRTASEPYTVITPSSSLAELEAFFRKSESFALVTDYERKFVLGVATPHDLQNFITRSGL
jgi:CBS domain containing-hemolysin-like protein